MSPCTLQDFLSLGSSRGTSQQPKRKTNEGGSSLDPFGTDGAFKVLEPYESKNELTNPNLGSGIVLFFNRANPTVAKPLLPDPLVGSEKKHNPPHRSTIGGTPKQTTGCDGRRVGRE